MKLNKRLETHKHYHDRRLKYIAPVSKFEWLNLFEGKDNISYDEVITQIIKFREKFYGCVTEKIDTPEFKNELMDAINAGVNLLHAVLLLYPDNEIHISYNRHVNKINHRLLDPEYKWGIDMTIEGREYYEEKII